MANRSTTIATINSLLPDNTAGDISAEDVRDAEVAVVDFAEARANHTGTQTLSTIAQSGATNGQVPSWDGSNWVPSTVSGGGGTIDSVPTDGSANAVSSNGVFDALAGKQATLTASDVLAFFDNGGDVSFSIVGGKIIGTVGGAGPSYQLVEEKVFTDISGWLLVGAPATQINNTDGGVNKLYTPGNTGLALGYKQFASSDWSIGDILRITLTLGTVSNGQLSVAVGNAGITESITSFGTSGQHVFTVDTTTTSDYYILVGAGTPQLPAGAGWIESIKIEKQL